MANWLQNIHESGDNPNRNLSFIDPDYDIDMDHNNDHMSAEQLDSLHESGTNTDRNLTVIQHRSHWGAAIPRAQLPDNFPLPDNFRDNLRDQLRTRPVLTPYSRRSQNIHVFIQDVQENRSLSDRFKILMRNFALVIQEDDCTCVRSYLDQLHQSVAVNRNTQYDDREVFDTIQRYFDDLEPAEAGASAENSRSRTTLSSNGMIK